MFILLTGVVFLLRAGKKDISQVQAWWNETWTYRNSISITNNTSEESNVYTTLSIGTSSLIGDSKLQADCGDLRFTDQGGNLLQYYLVSGCGTTTTSINLNHNIFPAGLQTIYYYYGNTSAQDGTTTSDFDTEASDYTIGSVASEEVTPGPIAYWKFDEGVGTTAHDSINTNDGLLSSATWQSEDMCISSKCIYSDGGTVNINNSTNFYFSDKMSLSFWWKPMTHHDEYAYRIINKSTTTDDSTLSFYYFGDYGGTYPANQGNLGMYANAGGSWKSVSPTYKVTDDDLGKWMKIDFVYDPSVGGLLYINGQSQGSAAGSGTLANNTASLIIGGGTPKCFYDEVKIYPYARSADQIKADYTAGLAGMGGNSTVNIGGNTTGKSLSDGLVGYWTMDKGVGTTIIDKSGNNNTGTFGTGDSAPSWGHGKFGIGTSFDGVNDYINIGSTQITIGNDMTISTWIKAGGQNQVPILSDRGTGGRLYYGLHSSGYGLVYYNSSSPLSIRTTTTIDDNTWHHLVFVRSGTTSTFYLDGTYNDSTTQTGYVAGNYPINIGYDASNNEFFDGLIDEVRIYNRALSASEVTTLYNWAPEPVGYWNFDEASGTTANDTSGNSHNGTLTNSPSWITGKYGSALQFDGSNYVNSINNIPNVYSFTLEAWVNSIGTTHGGVIDKFHLEGGAYAGYAIAYNKAANKFSFLTGNGTNFSWLDSTSTFSNNQWYHVAAVYDGSDRYLYINGTLDAGPSTYGFANASDPVAIGTNYANSLSSSPLEGLIDDVRIYNYARTPKQIQQDMYARSDSTKSTLPIAYWSFDEGYGTTTYDKINSNHATISSANWTNSGKIGKSLSFTYSRVQLPDSDSLGNLSSITFSAWINPTSLASNAMIKSARGVNWTSGHSVRLNTNGTISSFINGVTNTLTTDLADAITINTWTHLVTTYDGTNHKIYINGHLVKSASPAVTMLSTSGRGGYIGQDNDGDTPFVGYIDEVKIYNYALSEDEVKQDYNQGAALVMGQSTSNSGSTAPAGSSSQEYCIPGSTDPCSPPIAEWNFNERTGTSAYDSSGNGNTATFGTGDSAPTWITGKTGAALNFDGNDNLDYTEIPFDIGDTYTYSTWLKINSTSDLSWDGFIGDRLDGSGGYWLIHGGGYLRWYQDYYNSTTYLWNSNINSGDEFQVNQWFHLTITVQPVDSTHCNITAYINGKQVQNEPNFEISPRPSSKLFTFSQIGYGDNSRFFDGKIDQVRIYDYARTPAQIAWDYNRGKPIAHYKLDESQGSTAHDSSGNNFHGTLGTGDSAPTWTTGKLNNSASFDGNDKISIDTTAITIGEDMTISTWIKAGGQNQVPILSNRNGGRLYYGLTSSGYGFVYYTYASPTSLITTITLDDDTWHNLIFVRSGTTSTFYLDGKYNNSVTQTGYVSTNSPFNIGYDVPNGEYFTGLIDDVKVFNYALTLDQIKNLYNNGVVNFN